MHDGSLTTLEATVRHYIDADAAALNYDPAQLDPRLEPLVRSEQTNTIVATISADIRDLDLSDQEVDDVVAFLESLTASSIFQIAFDAVPDSVPSGLPVSGN
jgi:cytochrome c peroxidase